MLPTDRLGSARYCWPTSTNGRSGIVPRWTAFSLATISSKLATEVDRAGLAGRSGRPRDIALDGEVDLERSRPVTETAVGASDPGRQPVAEDVGGDRRRHVEHQHVAWRQFGRPRSRARPVSILPPWRSMSATRASAIACEPPCATTHPLAWPAAISISPTALVIGRSRREKAWAAIPAHSALASLRPPDPGQRGRRQHRAGSETRQRQRMARHSQDRLGGVGEQVVEARRRSARTVDAIADRRSRALSAVRSIDRYSTPAEPSSSGWAQSTAGCSQVSPSDGEVQLGQER